MILHEGFLKKYKSLRTQRPSVYNLEDFYFKVIQLNLRPDGSLWLGNRPRLSAGCCRSRPPFAADGR